MPTNFVILDCDVGSDDAWALLMLIRAEEKLRNVKLLGITCVAGNSTVDNVAKNTFRVLNATNRTDIPVYTGCSGPILPRDAGTKFLDFHGKDGFGDLQHGEEEEEFRGLVQKTHAVTAMYEFVCKHPGQVTLLLVGPLTNFALALSMFADFSEKVKEVFIMGGNIRGIGNTTRSAEFNFFFDPEAAHIVLQKTTCPITILPWESCMDDNVTISLDWRLNVIGSLDHPVVKLLTDVERAQYIPQGYTNWVPCDALLVAAFLFPEKMISKVSHWHATVELQGKFTRGQMVLDHTRSEGNSDNVRVVEFVNAECFRDIVRWTVDHPEFVGSDKEFVSGTCDNDNEIN